jgi:hypothetical protein
MEGSGQNLPLGTPITTPRTGDVEGFIPVAVSQKLPSKIEQNSSLPQEVISNYAVPSTQPYQDPSSLENVDSTKLNGIMTSALEDDTPVVWQPPVKQPINKVPFFIAGLTIFFSLLIAGLGSYLATRTSRGILSISERINEQSADLTQLKVRSFAKPWSAAAKPTSQRRCYVQGNYYSQQFQR